MEKSHFLHHNSRANDSLALKIYNCGLKQQHETRLLGMMINDTLTLDTHVDHLSSKITTTINLLHLLLLAALNVIFLLYIYMYVIRVDRNKIRKDRQ